jgi:hypothetical protein
VLFLLTQPFYFQFCASDFVRANLFVQAGQYWLAKTRQQASTTLTRIHRLTLRSCLRMSLKCVAKQGHVSCVSPLEPPMAFKAQSGMFGGAWKERRWRMRCTTARTGHACGSPEHPWPTVLPQTAFLLSVKISMTNVAESSESGGTVSGSMGGRPR